MPAISEFALDYALNGMPVFPLHTIVNGACSCGKGNCKSAGKHPRSPKGFKDATTDPEIITRWWLDHPDSNIGMATGKESGLTVLDIDPRNGGHKSFAKLELEHGPMPSTATQLTGGGGIHLFFEYPEGMIVRSRADLMPGIDIKADGGYVVVAPSKHLSGKEYVWKTKAKPAPMPGWLLEKIRVKEGSKSAIDPLPRRIEKGMRNSTLPSLAGSMRRKGANAESILAALYVENDARCKPPLSKEELEAIARSIARYKPKGCGPTGVPFSQLRHDDNCNAAAASLAAEQSLAAPDTDDGPAAANDNEQVESSERSQADRLVNLALKAGIKLFHDQFKKSHGWIRIENHYEIWSLRGQQFKLFLSQLGWQSEEHAFSNDSIGAALNVLDSMARFEGDEITLHNRVAYHEGSIYYDLTDRDWRAIKISSRGWEIVSHPPILFRRFAHQSTQEEPRRGGNLEDLYQFINVTNDQERLLLLAYLVAALVPDIPHPVLIVHGPQGATKTTLLRVLRRLIDSSQTETLTISTDLREFVQLLSHHWCSFFDNVSVLYDWTSDALCRAATGDAFSKRELYTDDEDFISHFRRCVALNGINIAVHKPDLLDRSILVGLQSIAPDQRKEERKFWKEFEEARPFLFGAMLTALSQAMALLPSIGPADLPRMADFAVWGCAIAKALGHSPEEFLSAFDANSEARNDEVILDSSIAAAIIALVGDRGDLELSPSLLLDRLTKLVSEQQAKAREWPKAPHILTRRIREILPNLAAIGIEVEIGGRTRESRKITIRKRPKPDVTNVTTSPSPSPSPPEVPSDPENRDAGVASDALPGAPGDQDTPSELALQVHATQESPKENMVQTVVPPQPPSKPKKPTSPVAILKKMKKEKAKAHAAQEASDTQPTSDPECQEGLSSRQPEKEER